MKMFNNEKPLYLQLREEIEKAIISGAAEEGKAIPSIRTLSQQYKLNPQTVSNALSELASDGIITKKRGIGFFVNENAGEVLKMKRTKEFKENELYNVLTKGKTLGMSKDEIKEQVERVYKNTGESYELLGN
ncbi:MAG: GntR family transcriptional regulator [Candidatus Cloacimonadota bacterium]|nr:MAG: GntR family transcriptional regulator [Candidatus Cloacimonadota bacterium]